MSSDDASAEAVQPADDDDSPKQSAEWADVVTCAHAAFVLSNDWWGVTQRLFSLIEGLNTDPADKAFASLRAAVSFTLKEKRSPHAEVVLEPFDPLGDHAPSPKAAATEVKAEWRLLAQQVGNRAAEARLYDLLWQAGSATAIEDCTSALEAYLDVATLPPYRVGAPDGDEEDELLIEWRDQDRDLALGRALTISPIASKSEAGGLLAVRAREVAINRLDAYLAAKEPNAGNTFLLLSLLVRHGQKLTQEQRGTLFRLVELAIDKYQMQDWLVDEAAALLIKMRPSERARAQRIRVQARLHIADERPQAAVKMHFLELAARLARDFQIDDLRTDATRRLQSINRDDLELVTVTSDFKLPREYVDAEVYRMCRGADWRDSLASWLDSPSPTGSATENLALAERSNSSSLVRALGMPTVILGEDGLPRWTASSDQDELAWTLAQIESHRLQLSGLLLADSLDQVRNIHGEPEEADLEQFLSREGTSSLPLAGAMTRSLLRYWRGDYEGSLHTSVVRVEAAARRLVLDLDEPAYNVARGSSPGVYAGLPVLLGILEQHGFDEDWSRFIRSFLLGPAGANARHDLAHGFSLQATPRTESALALRALGLFVWLLGDPGHVTVPLTPSDGPLLSASVAGAIFNDVRAMLTRQLSPRALMRHEGQALWRMVGAAWSLFQRRSG